MNSCLFPPSFKLLVKLISIFEQVKKLLLAKIMEYCHTGSNRTSVNCFVFLVPNQMLMIKLYLEPDGYSCLIKLYLEHDGYSCFVMVLDVRDLRPLC